MNKCNGLLGLLFGHKFEARYDTEESEGKWPFKEGSLESQISSAVQSGYNISVSAIVESTKSRKETYVHDVCKRCGEIIERKQ